MNKKIRSTVVICLLLTITFFIITYSNDVIESVSFSISIWRDNLFPSLFPFFVISNLLLNYGFVDILGILLKDIMEKYFNLPGECGFVLAASLFSGFPSGAKYTKDLVDNNKITLKQAARLLTFTHYSNPLFIYGMVGNILLCNKALATIILISHIVSNLLIGMIFSGKREKKKFEKYEPTLHKIKTPDKSFGELLSNSIFDTLKTLFLLLGIVTSFLVVSTIINNIIPLDNTNQALLSGLLEMTQGVRLVSALQHTQLIKAMLISSIISFGGLSVHMQVLSIISSSKIKYKPFFLARILHAILAPLLVFILYTIFL